jgi:hypothetical protein
MTAVPIELVCDEVISLVSESAEESQKGAPRSALSLLLEAQFLLGELIQSQLETIPVRHRCIAPAKAALRVW